MGNVLKRHKRPRESELHHPMAAHNVSYTGIHTKEFAGLLAVCSKATGPSDKAVLKKEPQYPPPPLLELPLHIQLQILENIDYEDFECFALTSKAAANTASFLRTRLPTNVYELVITPSEIRVCREKYLYGMCRKEYEVKIDLRIQKLPLRFNAQHLVLEFDLDDVHCALLVRKLRESETKVDEIKFIRDCECGEEQFTQLFQTSGAKRVFFHEDVPTSILCHPILRNIENISVTRDVSDDELFQLRSKQVSLKGNFALGTLCQYLQEWVDGTRDIEQADLTVRTLPLIPPVDQILRDINFNVIWTPLTHTGAMPRCPGWASPLLFIYTIQRGEETLYVKLGMNFMKAILDVPKHYWTKDNFGLFAI